MEKKTIGAFIAALRKANGLTQRELAEKLGVSDKAVSRWERDEALPDLSLIPVLAEIFNVTCDELLKGERIAPSAQTIEKVAAQNEKQIRNLLNSAKIKYQINSIISLGLALMGLLAALLINFGFLRAYIGFWAGCVFFTAAILCQIVFTIQAKARLHGGEVLDAASKECLQDIDTFGIRTAVAIVSAFTVTLPLLGAGDAYYGVTWSFLLPRSLACILSAILLYKIVPIILQFIQRRRNHESLSSVERFIIKRSLLILMVPTMTLIILYGLSSIDSKIFIQPVIYNSWDEFKEAIETPITSWGEPLTLLEYRADEYGEFEGCDMIAVYAMEDGSIYEMPLFPPEEIWDADRNVLCSFRHLNMSIGGVWPNTLNTESRLPVSCYMKESYSEVDFIRDKIAIVILISGAVAMLYLILNTAKSAKKAMHEE